MSTNPVRSKKKYQSQWKQARYYREKYPFMSEMWYPLAVRDIFKDSGGFLDGYAWRGVLHTTEGSTYAGARPSYAKGNSPHFTVSFEGGAFKVWQHIPLNKAARALAHPAGTPETNRARCIQIEIVGRAAQSHTFGREYLSGLGRLMRWIESNTGIQRRALDFKGANEGIVLAKTTSVIRLPKAEWINFNGWCGHQHVPYNSHWDPGNIDIDYLINFEAGVRPMIDPPLDFNNVVAIRRDIYTNGVYILQEDGAVFAWEGAVYYGGSNTKPYWGDRKAARLVWPSEFEAETGGHSVYKYHIQAIDGAYYGYPE
jgi:hypothetical protein